MGQCNTVIQTQMKKTFTVTVWDSVTAVILVIFLYCVYMCCCNDCLACVRRFPLCVSTKLAAKASYVIIFNTRVVPTLCVHVMNYSLLCMATGGYIG